MMIWPRYLLIQVFCLFITSFSPNSIASTPDWEVFKQQFISADGRVSDNGNNNITHTEGQGMAMLMAIQSDDRSVFDNIWNWTRGNLQVREDKLFAWSWSDGIGVRDINNASDGDLFIAWALARAYKKWGDSEYLSSAIEISQTIRLKLLRVTQNGTVILPGAQGFEKENGYILNLSYWVFPAFSELNQIDPSKQWSDLEKTGIRLIQKARFGKWQLPPDWLLLAKKPELTMNKRFGYDAVRIPLYLIWGKVASKELMRPFQGFWKAYPNPDYLPSWTDLETNAVGNYNASIGFHNIAKLTLDYPVIKSNEILWPDSSQSYYSYMLTFFSQLAINDLKK